MITAGANPECCSAGETGHAVGHRGARPEAMKGEKVGQISLTNGDGTLEVNLETRDDLLEKALQHPLAEASIRCAVLMVVSSLAEGGRWPEEILSGMARIMANMQDSLSDGSESPDRFLL